MTLVVGVGCASADPAPVGPALPNSGLKPAGTGWACFRDRLSTAISICARPDNCEPLRIEVAKELDRRGVPYELTPCTPRPGAACLTLKPAVRPATYVCMEEMSECLAAAAEYRKLPVDYTNVSTCAAW